MTFPRTERIIQLKCECSAESLEIVHDVDDYYLSIWKAGIDGQKVSWPQRLKHCWQILRKGSPYGDQLVLSSKKMKQLKNFIE
jgi:hypothetical protein